MSVPRLLPKSTRSTKILSVFWRLSSTYWSSLVPGFVLAPLFAAGVLVVPTLTTVLAPRFSGVALPFSTSVRACSRSARFFSSAGFGRSSDWARAGPESALGAAVLTWGAALAVTAGMPRVVPSPAATTRLNSPADFFRTVPPSSAIVSREGAARRNTGRPDPAGMLAGTTERGPRRYGVQGATRARPRCATAVAVAGSQHDVLPHPQGVEPDQPVHVCATAHSRRKRFDHDPRVDVRSWSRCCP